MLHIVEKLLSDSLCMLESQGKIPANLQAKIKLERNRDSSKGDLTTNLAFIMARFCQQTTQDLAAAIIHAMATHPAVERVEVGGVGFINFFMHKEASSKIIANILTHSKEKFYPEPDPCYSARIEEYPWFQEMSRKARPEIDLLELRNIQYAYARTCRVLHQFHEQGFIVNREQDCKYLDNLNEPAELALIILMRWYPGVIIATVNRCWEPQQLAYYLRELAKALLTYYNAIHIVCENTCLQNARLCLLTAVRQIFRSGLQVLGASTHESM